ncbi:hypothetical protein PTKIN_Ptkin03bG0161200 [Pterospermum kingtungense]
MAALFVVLAATLLQRTYARNYTVGDSTGWQVPLNNSNFYEDWASNKDFVVGDILVFNFTTGRHDVAEVTEAAYDACNITNTISIDLNGPAIITLNRTGDYYFFCAFPNHCSRGQKLKVEARSTSSVPSPGSSPTSPSSASSLVATLSLFFMSIALVFLC